MNTFLSFFQIILKGYGQVLICLNTFSGLLVAMAIFYGSVRIGFLTLASVIVSSFTAFIIKAKPGHVNSGVYGFNGVVLGVAWLWFFKFSVSSVVLMLIAACFSSLLMKMFTDISSRTRTNLPVFSIPSVIIIWAFIIFLRYFRPGCIVTGLLFQPGCLFSPAGIAALLILFSGVLIHSRKSALSCLLSFLVSIIVIYFIAGKKELINLEFYLYNTVPCALAIGGVFLVFNRKTLLLAGLAVALVVCLTFLGFRYFPIPIFVAPFNVVTIFCIWLVKSGILKTKKGYYAVPMDLVSTPELGIKWREGEIYADNYWLRIERKGI